MHNPLARLSGSTSGPLSETEMAALGSLHNACADVEQARAASLSHALYLKESANRVGGYVSATGFEHHAHAVKKLGEVTLQYERQVEAVLWRYASSYVVLAITVLDRLVRGQPPLAADEIRELCEEPTLGRLRAALAIPTSGLIAPSDGEAEDDLPIGSYAHTAVEEFYADLLLRDGDPKDGRALDGSCLSAVRPAGMAPFSPFSFVLTVAAQVSWEIFEFVERA